LSRGFLGFFAASIIFFEDWYIQLIPNDLCGKSKSVPTWQARGWGYEGAGRTSKLFAPDTDFQWLRKASVIAWGFDILSRPASSAHTRCVSGSSPKPQPSRQLQIGEAPTG
jgi:hypothetical protein